MIKKIITIPDCLLPYCPVDPKLNSPAWLTPQPIRLYKLHRGGALTLTEVRWRDMLGRYWTCPRGFFTDGASVPWLLRWLWDNYDEKTIRPAIIHDLRYALHDYFVAWQQIDTRKAADQDLFYGMRLDCPSRAGIYRFAVSMFGRAVYERINKEPIMLEWFDVIQQSEQVMDAWIQGVIIADAA